MRHNLPVTDKEFPFPAGQTLVSTTDTKGFIVYCNPAFIQVSGFSKQELLGQPHNIIRHPDMPEEAFRDMWDTISSGRPWSALVKNRRKDGSFYWVMANVTPLLNDQGQCEGYMSVRTEPQRAQVQEAQELYAQMRRERDQGKQVLTLKAGRLIRLSAWARLREQLRLGLPSQLLITLLAVAALPSLLTAYITTPSPWNVYVQLVLVLLMVAGAWLYLLRNIVTPLGQLIVAANRMAGGNLTQAVLSNRQNQIGELQKALTQLSVNLLSVVRDAREQSLSMQEATQEISQGNVDLSQRTEAQASNLQQTAAALEEITGTVRETAASAQSASALSVQARELVEKGRDAVNSVADTMQAIEAASTRIGDITQVIDSIAFQTNILALNAAVEAARAGEQGRGFAVVAAEVRTLAQRTSSAAKEIKQLIENSVAKVGEGSVKTDAARHTMGETVDGVSKVTEIVGEISHATNEQLSGISQINSAVGHLDGITQQNAALVEEMTASAYALNGIAQSVSETVQVFRTDSQHSSAVQVSSKRPRDRLIMTVKMLG
ncbi:MAG: methyl-accepting chemotaxis protein [Comamonas sp.]|uniref:methyl-accepting chemotaxis protein n=1 Tax=Comamonas sp. TaxID=34028 RepID=UPI0028175D79|nr:methyl-accepting chemotaxis protein [Comamonas sp.]MDR0213992.1 methyl-accepting chemotaxis protein [Comamonas sp.]